MASTYTTNFGIEKIGSGDQSGSWGTTTNFNLDILDRVASFKAVAITGTTHTLTVREASPDSGTENLQDGMFRVIKFTGALGANNTVTVAPNTTTAYFIFVNSTTDSGSSGPYSVVIKQGSGAEITIPNGHSSVVFCDGAGSGAAVTDAFAKLYVSDAIQIGSGAAEDTKIVFDGNAQDYYIGLDDSADDLVIGLGSAVGTTPAISIDENQAVVFPAAAVTVGDGTAEDTKVVFDGNAQDFYIGLDDSADDLVFGLGSTVGSTVAFAIDENQVTNFSHAAIGSTQTASISSNTTLDFQTYQNFVLTFTGNVTLDNPSTEAVGQSGFIIIIQDGTGSRTLALGTDYETAGGAGLTISTAASAVDVVPYVVKASGSIQLGAAQLAFA